MIKQITILFSTIILFTNCSHSQTKQTIKTDCSCAVGNFSSNYPIRISGASNGCIGYEGCEEIPTDNDLHKAVLQLKEDLNADTVIDCSDIEPLIKKIGDINKDGSANIYDIVYPNPIKYTNSIKNPSTLKEDGSLINLIGKIELEVKQTGRHFMKIILDSPIKIIHTHYGDGQPDLKENNGAEYDTISKKEIYLFVDPSIIIYKNKNVILEGKIMYGNSQSYIDGVAFNVAKVIGAVK